MDPKKLQISLLTLATLLIIAAVFALVGVTKLVWMGYASSVVTALGLLIVMFKYWRVP